MKRHFHCYFHLLLIVALSACRSASDPAPRAVALDREIELAPGDRAAFGPQGLDVQFVRVLEDSRCPSDVTCVWAGEVKVELSTRADAAETQRHQIVAGKDASVGELKLSVVEVRPERISTREIAPEEYRVVLKAQVR